MRALREPCTTPVGVAMACVAQDELFAIKDMEKRVQRLVELNVTEQVTNLFKTGAIQRRRRETFKEGGVAYPRVHGLVYAPGEGVLRKLPVDFDEILRKNSHIYDMYSEPK
jgi:carbonic anhydrase